MLRVGPYSRCLVLSALVAERIHRLPESHLLSRTVAAAGSARQQSPLAHLSPRTLASFSSSSADKGAKHTLDCNMYLLGLTGSIGMGKSFVTGVLGGIGVPVLDSDAVVHQLYAKGGAAVKPVGEAFDGVVVDGAISRQELSNRVLGNDDAMKRLEGIVHPLVEEERWRFLSESEEAGHRLVVFDIPLLYEKGYESDVDAVAVVSTGDTELQRERVLARPGMTPEKFESILSRQVPDEDKRRRADHIIDSSCTTEETRAAVIALVGSLEGISGGVWARMKADKATGA